MTSASARRGFTLIELVVVIALMAIIAGVSAPALGSLGRQRADSSAFEVVASLFVRSRTTAIDRAIAVHVTIDPQSGRYWIDPLDSVGVLALPVGASLSAQTRRVHFRFSPGGEVTYDDVLFVKQGDVASPIVFQPWTGELHGDYR